MSSEDSVTIRISDTTNQHLDYLIEQLRSQKNERHSKISVLEKIVVNANLEELYGLNVAGDDDLDGLV